MRNMPDFFPIAITDYPRAETEKNTCVAEAWLNGEIFGMHHSVRVTPPWKCAGRQCGPLKNLGFESFGLWLYLPELLSFIRRDEDVGIVNSLNSIHDEVDLARLLTKPCDIRVAVEQAKCIELMERLPMEHALHLPTRILPRGTRIRPRHDSARTQLTRLGEDNGPDIRTAVIGAAQFAAFRIG